MDDKLTDRQFWLEYWKNKKDLIQNISDKNYFNPIFQKLIKENTSIKNSIEIGGFPGYFSIYLEKYFKIKSTLLDYVIHRELVIDLLKYNDLVEEDLNLIETDLFVCTPSSKFDLTFSSGFIEHFSDTVNLIQKHVDFMNPGGTLLIIVPNFLGINGWINRKYNFESFKKHYLKCMDKDYLKRCAQQCELEDVETFYYGRFSVWLENISQKGLIFKMIFQGIWILGKAMTKIIPIETKRLSPYTVLIAKKKVYNENSSY